MMKGETDSLGSLVAKVLQEVRAGVVSSVAAEAMLFPLDTVKLRLQVQGGGVLEVFQGIVRKQGFLGLYGGLIGRLIQTIASNVGFFIWQTVLIHVVRQKLQGQRDDEEASEEGSRPSKTRTPKLSTGLFLLVNMVAQQINRLLTTPIDVVANVNQADPNSKGFIHTFIRLAREGGRATLWRGLGVALLLSFNPALMFTLVDRLSTWLSLYRGLDGAPLRATDLFWISGVSKMVATIVTYPLIRAKAVIQTVGAGQVGLWQMLAEISRNEGARGLYAGVWIMSYKTVLFNSLMMALKQKVGQLLAAPRPWARNSSLAEQRAEDSDYCKKVTMLDGTAAPWVLALEGKRVVYVDGAWTFLHDAQDHFLREVRAKGDHLVVGVHGDECLHDVTGAWPRECYAARLKGIREHPSVSSVLAEAPWEIDKNLLQDLGITKVMSGTVNKMMDCSTQPSGAAAQQTPTRTLSTLPGDPYAVCRDLGIFEEVQSLSDLTEHEAWLQILQRVVTSNVDASIDWRILVPDSGLDRNPGYGAGTRPRARSADSLRRHYSK